MASSRYLKFERGHNGLPEQVEPVRIVDLFIAMFTSDVLTEILQWSLSRPDWQRDALRRLFASESISTEAVTELVELCKAAHGLASGPRTARPLTEQHLAVKNRDANVVSLVSVTHHHGVNALATEQTVSFGPSLTVVYGENAAGKSGYTRILKRACRSRGMEDILGNVLSGEAPLVPTATIKFREGDAEDTIPWTQDGIASESLARISVFDAHCAPVYLRDKTDVAFRPFSLDVFDKLSALCSEVRSRLEQEQKQLGAVGLNLPPIPDGTRARELVDGLTALTKIDDVKLLSTLSLEEERKLSELRKRVSDFQALDPKQRARELNLKAERLNIIAEHVARIAARFGESGVTELRATADAARTTGEALALVRSAAFDVTVLHGTGNAAWIDMWEAAERFAAATYQGADFPNTSEGARCPLCQQAYDAGSSDRMRHFAEFMTSRAQSEAHQAESKYRSALEQVESIAIERSDTALAIEDLATEDPEAAEDVSRFLLAAVQIRAQINSARAGDAELPKQGIDANPAWKITSVIDALRARADELKANKSALSATEAVELRELEARLMVKENLQRIFDEIERKKHLSAYRQCLDDATTQAITRKSTELTKALVTDQLRDTFKGELGKLDFTHLSVEVRSVGGAKGVLFHQVCFSNAPGVSVIDVLSEGESRALSLAAFLTELSTATAQSAIVFDDPVSSLDHIWRGRIARRLVAEAKSRQVIVFTHDVLFLRLLMDEATKQTIQCDHQYLQRGGVPGVSSSSLPWLAMLLRERIGHLRKKWQVAEKLHRTASSEEYDREARDIFGHLREAWEQAVVEVLLNDVVERYRPSIQTQKVKSLDDITAADCKVVDEAMTECSRWIRGHDQAAADGTPLPVPSDIKSSIDEIEKWAKTIRQRREKQQEA